MSRDMMKEILEKLKTRDKRGVNDGLALIQTLRHRYLDEKFGRMKGNTATKQIAQLIDELMILAKDPNGHIRYAAIRGLGAVAFSDQVAPRIFEIARCLLESLFDEDGRVRRASVHALDHARIYFPADFDTETASEKKSSIDQALNAIYCLHLEFLLESRGFAPTRGVAS